MLGLCSITFRDKTVDEVIALVKEADLDAIEWGSDIHVPETDPANAKKVATKMADAGLTSSSYGTYYKLGTFKDFTPFLEVANTLGASTLRVWAGEKGSAETDAKTRHQIVEDAQRVAILAAEAGLTISLEYHANTLTDTPESTKALMHDIHSKNVFLYWQPAEVLSVAERIESLPELAPYITNVHVFNWEHYRNRFPLADAADDWTQYIDLIREHSPHEQTYLLEFAPGDDPVDGFLESAKTLKTLV